MKLRNKKTGEIGIYLYSNPQHIGIGFYSVMSEKNPMDIIEYGHDFEKLYKEWDFIGEDYEEPEKDYIRVIESFIHYAEEADDSFYCDKSVKKFIEKLKAWKRLENAGFKFKEYEGIWGGTDDGACGGEGKIDFAILGDFNPKDLDLLFGGKE